jgi:hypothetical protein
VVKVDVSLMALNNKFDMGKQVMGFLYRDKNWVDPYIVNGYSLIPISYETIISFIQTPFSF